MTQSKFYIEDTQWAAKLELEYEDYMMQLQVHAAPEEDLPEGAELPSTLSGQPYCGCMTCETRETLFFLVPRISQAFKEGKITLA
jgi:hypothetical protein